MYPTPEKRIAKAFEMLKQLTTDAESEMSRTEDLTVRKQVLAKWEREMGGYVRNEYRDLKRALGLSDVLLKRLGKLTKQMVLDRSVLEGLAEGKGPAPHQAGGAFPPPSNVDATLVKQVEDVLDDAIAELKLERKRVVPGELPSAFMARCNESLEAALELIESTLVDSGAEYKELYERLRLKAAKTLGQAILERGERPAERKLSDVSGRLHARLRRHLHDFLSGLDGTPVDKAAEHSLAWAQSEFEKAQTELALASIGASLRSEWVWFERELKAVVGEATGLWDKPPVFERITRADLDSRVRQGTRNADGVYVEFYPDGHLKKAAIVRQGVANGTLNLGNGVAHARYEDSANVAEFHPTGTIEEYGGRYERDIKARITFKDWVIQRVGEMLG
jgi:hypothetical protein